MALLVPPNPSFETDTADWDRTGGGTTLTRVEDATAPHGDFVCKVDVSGSGGLGGARSDTFAASPSETHTARLWAKVPVDREKFRLGISERNSGGSEIGFTGGEVVPTGDWQEVEISRAFGSSGVGARIFARVDGGSSGTFYIDAVGVEPDSGEVHEASASGAGEGTGSAEALRIASAAAAGQGVGTGSAIAAGVSVRRGEGSGLGTGTGTGAASATRYASASGTGEGTGSATAAVLASAADLVPPNPSFELPIGSEWVANGAGVSIERVTDPEAPDGLRVLRVTTGEEGWEGIGGLRSASFDAEPGKTYRFAMLVRHAEFRNITPAISERDAEDNQIAFHEGEALGGDGRWQIIETTATFTTGVKARVFLRMDGPGDDNPIFHVDAVPAVWPPPKPKLRFRSGFETGDLSEWTEPQEIGSGSVTVIDSQPLVGQFSGRAAISEGGGAEQRAELYRLTEKSILVEGDRVYYALDLRLSEGFPLADTWQLVWQLRQNSHPLSSPVELSVWGGSWRLSNGPSTGIEHAVLWEGPAIDAARHRFVTLVHVSADPDVGFVEFWVDGEKVLDRAHCQTLPDDAEFLYAKAGYYRDPAIEEAGHVDLDEVVLSESASDVFPIPTPARVVSEPVDDALFVELRHVGGGKSRWAGDEPDAAGIPQGIKSSNSAPGGHRDFSCSLARDPRRDWPDLELVDEVVVKGRTSPLGRSVFEGQTAHFPSSLGDDVSIGVNAVGHSAQLSEDETWRALYVALGFEDWGEPTLARKEFVADQGFVQGRIPISTEGGLTWDPPAQALSTQERSEAHYAAPAGLPVSRLGYRGKRKGSWSNWEAAQIFSRDVETFGEGTESAALTLDNTARTVALANARRYLMLRALVSAGHTSPAGVQQSYDRIAVYGDTGVPLRDIPGELPGVYGHDAIAHMLSTGAPELRYHVGRTIVPNTSFVLGDLAFLDPGTVDAAIQHVNGYFLNNYAVWDRKEFHWHPWDPQRLTWKAKIQGGAHWAPAGRQADTMINGLVVAYEDHEGRKRTVGPPGSGCDVESPLLRSTDRRNPYTRRGRRNWETLPVGYPLAYPSMAIQIGHVNLLERALPQRSGTLVIRPLGPGHVPQIEHPTMGPMPIWAMRAGDFCELDGWPDPEPFRVLEVDPDHDAKTLVAQLDTASPRMSAIMERAGSRLKGVL